MRHGSLFSGIGGFDLAAEWMGWENVFHCEWNEFGQKVLKYYWPKAISYHDITKTNFSVHRGEIDILTGGFPCQPYSSAGKRLGKEDERHLWPEMLRAIREIQPTWVVGENVLGLVNWNGGLVFHEVQTDLEAEGYEVQPYVLPAVSVNAPHRRDRVWFVAYAKNNGLQRNNKFRENIGTEQRSIHEYQEKTWDEIWSITKRSSLQRNGTDTDLFRNNQCSENGCNKSKQPKNSEQSRDRRTSKISGYDAHGDAPDTESQGSRQQPSEDRRWQDRRSDNNGEVQYAPDTDNEGLQGCKVNGGTRGIRQDRNKQLAGCISPNWSNFPTVSPIYARNDGFSDRLDLTAISEAKWRNESIKASGNAVVPQVVLQIFKAIEQYDQRRNSL